MTKGQIEAEIAQLKMDYINLQGDIEKLESTGNARMIENAESRLDAMEKKLAELNEHLAQLG